jgi:hypothetical protein
VHSLITSGNQSPKVAIKGEKKTEKLIKSRKPKKKKPKKPNRKKNRLNRLKFWKNQPVWFWFYKQKTKKTKPRKTGKKTEPNWFELIFVLKNRTETSQFEPVSVFLKKFYKNRTEPKMITPDYNLAALTLLLLPLIIDWFTH